jgi:L-cysteine S-thiosulfotransferase
MARRHGCVSRLITICLASVVLFAGSNLAWSAECKRKTSGFYLLDANPGGGPRLGAALQSMSASLTGRPGDPERGRELLSNRQKGDCLSCHKLSLLSSIADQGAVGPSLDGIASRYGDSQLRQVLVQPKAYFPETMMPAYYSAEGGEASILTAAEVEDLLAYLKTLK